MADWSNTTPPTITGSRVVGGTLTANPGVWSPTPSGYSYLWERADDTSGTNRETISGATGGTYTIDPIDTNKQLRVGVYPTIAPSGQLLASRDPSKLTLHPDWTNYQTGAPGAPTSPPSGALAGSGYETEMTTPSIMRAIADPTGGGLGFVYELTTTQDSQYTAGSGSVYDRCDLWENNGILGSDGQRIYREGADIWEHYKIRIPSSWPSAANASGGWSQLLQHHTLGGIPASSIETSGVSPQIRNTNPPQLWWLIPGGNAASGNIYGSSGPPIVLMNYGNLQFDHWYDFLVHMVVSTSDSTAFTQLILDGTVMTPAMGVVVATAGTFDTALGGWKKANLQFYGATIDQPNFEYSNYHKHVTSNVTVYYSQFRVGTSQQSVAF